MKNTQNAIPLLRTPSPTVAMIAFNDGAISGAFIKANGANRKAAIVIAMPLIATPGTSVTFREIMFVAHA